MSAALDVLKRAQTAGLILYREGNECRCFGHPLAVSALLPELRAHRDELRWLIGKKPDNFNPCDQWVSE